MKCTKCGHVTNLTDSISMGNTVRRFRVCPNCGNKFYTFEIPEGELKSVHAFLGSK